MGWNSSRALANVLPMGQTWGMDGATYSGNVAPGR